MVEVTYIGDSVDIKMIWRKSDSTLWDLSATDFDIDLAASVIHIRRKSTGVEIPTKTPTGSGAQLLIGELHATIALTDFPTGTADRYEIWGILKNVGATKQMTSDDELFDVREH